LPAGGFFAPRFKDEGIDGLVGLLETHGCGEIAKLAEGLEIIPRHRQEYHGLIVEEIDVLRFGGAQ
jgi:two-component system sensor histidine kinase KdpD